MLYQPQIPDPVIRYSITTFILLLAAFIAQQFLPVVTALYDSRILLVQLVFLCCAVTVPLPTMLVLAFVGGLLWDAQCALGPHGGDPEVYFQQVESLRFGYSVLLFGGMGLLMHGIRPLFLQGKWQFSVLLSGVAIFLYLGMEYLMITVVRGGFILTEFTVLQVMYTALLTMTLSPVVFAMLYLFAKYCRYALNPESEWTRRRRQHRN